MARYASSRMRLQMCWLRAWNSALARVSSVARARQRHIDQRLEPARVRRHHGDAVGEEHRLVDRVRDENDGASLGGRTVLSPDSQQLVLEDDAGLRVERGQRLVHQQHLGLQSTMRRASATRWRMPPESWCGYFISEPVRPTSSMQLRTRRSRAFGVEVAPGRSVAQRRTRRCRGPSAMETARNPGTSRRDPVRASRSGGRRS